jgi:hypothetical protein
VLSIVFDAIQRAAKCVTKAPMKLAVPVVLLLCATFSEGTYSVLKAENSVVANYLNTYPGGVSKRFWVSGMTPDLRDANILWGSFYVRN